MPVNYGAAIDGDVTFSSNTTLKTMGSYRNLTVESGVTVTVPHGSVLQVTDTLTIEGTITVNKRAGSSGYPKAGDGAGCFFVMAKEIVGSGTIKSNGESGGNIGGYDRFNNLNSYGEKGLPPALAGSSDNIIKSGSGGGNDAVQNSSYSTAVGNGGVSAGSVTSRDLLSVWIDEWIVPSASVSSLPMAKILPGGGGGGGKPANTNDGNSEDSSGGGGAGGSCGGLGGQGASGGKSANTPIVAGVGGGGAGGVIAIICENISNSLLVEATGGQGGICATDNYLDGGGGGGGGGGLVLVISTNKQLPQTNLSGGPPGEPRSPQPGDDGVLQHIDMSLIQ
jgi:hypothetical protein